MASEQQELDRFDAPYCCCPNEEPNLVAGELIEPEGSNTLQEEAVMTRLRRFMKDDSGQGLVEYVLIIAVVALGVILALGYFRTKVGDAFKRTGDSIDLPLTTYTTGG